MNKKIVILVVVVECILAVLMIGIVGKAIETYFNEIKADEIYFTTHDGEKLEKGDLYKEKENVIEKKDNDFITIEVARIDRGYQLDWMIIAEDTSDKSVTFTAESKNENYEAEVNETGYVSIYALDEYENPFNENDEISVIITIRTVNGKTATILLRSRQNPKSGTVDID